MEESTVSNLEAVEDFVPAAAGCFHFCTRCHRMLPMNRNGLAVSRCFFFKATAIGCFNLLPNDASSQGAALGRICNAE